MKPDHYKKNEPLGNCGGCLHRMWVFDLEKNICTKHAFTLLTPLADCKCDDFATTRKTARRNLLDVVHGISPRLEDHPTKPVTLILEDAYIASSDVALRCASGAMDLDVRITGYCNGHTCDFKVKALNILVEDT